MIITTLKESQIFVFGSNLAGIHGAGAARQAYDSFGAVWGQGEGLQGQSYAIPTKDAEIRTLKLFLIQYYVGRFLEFAAANPNLEFLVTPIGTGLAGYTLEDIEPFFFHIPNNVILLWKQ